MIEMKHYLPIIGILTGLLLCTGICWGDVPVDTDTLYPWNGSFSSEDVTLYILQNETGISGGYVPVDLDLLDPGMLAGNLSDDGKTYSGSWIETGGVTYTLSDDNSSFTITGYATPIWPMTESVTYVGNATRIGSIADPTDPWTGSYTSSWKEYHLIRNGSSLTGVAEPLPDVRDETGVLNGSISADGRTFTGSWIEQGDFRFELTDNGSSMNINFTRGLKQDGTIQ